MGERVQKPGELCKKVDAALFRAINGVSGPWWDSVMALVTTPSSWYPAMAILAVWLVYKERGRGAVALISAMAAVGIGDALGYHVLKALFARARPCVDLPDVRILVGCGDAFSFPSNHAINSLAVAGALGYFFRPLLWGLVPLGLLVCLSRVAVGAHYPSDVVAGAVLGFAIGGSVAWGAARLWIHKFGGRGGRKAVFLDRDGCVNVENDHIRDIAQFQLYSDSAKSIKRLNDAGYAVVVITNQSGVARGYMTEELLREVNALMLKQISEGGGRIDRVEYCPHHPEGVVKKYAVECDCRKPRPGMILRAGMALGLDFSKSFVVGDKISDIELGPATGMKAILVRTGFGERDLGKINKGEATAPDFVASGIKEAVDWILGSAHK
ncbi:MAG: HAD-IIIA family hydrolase [Nitrospinae bacterium]|nr:HAD-IIIA family hydrolase [Nitrospinota bacterium]MBF0634798.1 HAD-IIIA family hydrolase [Nitrospinota bacterium]